VGYGAYNVHLPLAMSGSRRRATRQAEGEPQEVETASCEAGHDEKTCSVVDGRRVLRIQCMGKSWERTERPDKASRRDEIHGSCFGIRPYAFLARDVKNLVTYPGVPEAKQCCCRIRPSLDEQAPEPNLLAIIHSVFFCSSPNSPSPHTAAPFPSIPSSIPALAYLVPKVPSSHLQGILCSHSSS